MIYLIEFLIDSVAELIVMLDNSIFVDIFDVCYFRYEKFDNLEFSLG